MPIFRFSSTSYHKEMQFPLTIAYADFVPQIA